jgi:hypothetical protein
MAFDATFNNISVISWRSVLLMEETGVPGENHRLVTDYRKTCLGNKEAARPGRSMTIHTMYNIFKFSV